MTSTPLAKETSPGTIVRWGLWFALAAGLVDGAALLLHHRVIQRAIHLSAQLAWMAPVGSVVWFLPVIVLLLGISAVRRRGLRPGIVIGVLASFAWATLTLIPSNLHPIAAMLLALGLGVQTARMSGRFRVGFDRITRITLPLMIVLVTVTAGVMIYWPRYAERRAAARLGPAAPGARNVVLIVWDTVRRASLSLYGYDRPTTPKLEAWRKRGVLFEHPFATTSWTLPSHASMFTGRLMHEMSANWIRPFDGAWPTLAQWLQSNGYRTGGFVANALYLNADYGLSRGFQRYEVYPISFGELVNNSSIGRALSHAKWIRYLIGYQDIPGRKTGEEITSSFLNWVPTTSGRPFFAFLNYLDAHQPYLPPKRFDEQFGSPTPRDFSMLDHRPLMGNMKRSAAEITAPQLQREREAYEASIAYLDDQVDRLLRSLEERGLLQNTVVIITADHGEQFKEHEDLITHGNSLYRFATEVPLLVIAPSGATPGTAVPQPVSLSRIPATVAELALPNHAHPFPGQGLTSSTDTTTPVISELILAFAPDTLMSVTTGEYRAIWRTKKAPKLYSFRDDPAEIHDLAPDSAYAAVLQRLRSQFDSARATARPSSAP